MFNLYTYLWNHAHSKQKFLKTIRIFHTLFLGLLLVLACSTYSYGAVAAGYSEYYIPGDETTMRLIFDSLDDADAAGDYDMHTVISVTAWADNTIVYYDHWEDGYDFDPADPAGTADERIVLSNTGDQYTFESSNIPTNPRGTATYYDGGDHVYVAGGSVTVTRASWIEGVGVGNQSAAWEIYPVKPQLTTYVVPFGENLGFADFNRVFVLIQATADNTTFTVDYNGDGTPDALNQNRDADKTDPGDVSTVTLQKGQTFLLDRVSACPNGTNCTTNPGSLNSGTVVQGNATLQVKFVAGNPGQNYCARGLSAFPRGYWTKDYYAPLDDPTNAARGNTDYYLYNPHASALTINWESTTSSGSFSIPSGGTVSYRTAAGAVPADSGLYFKADGDFWGVGVGNAGSNAYEWGFSLLPSTFLYDEHFLGWAPGSIPLDTTGNPGNQDDDGVFLIAAQDNTRVFVDFDNDGVADMIDADGNGTPESSYVTLNRLQTQFFYDPANAVGGGDLSKAHFWATGPFTMAYGENSDTANTTTPSLDLGYVAIPGSDFISLVLTVDKAVSPQVVPAASGSQAVFTLTVNSLKYTVDGVSVTDFLPANWDFVNNSAQITLPDKSTVSGSAANPTKSGSGPYTLDWPSSLLGDMAENQEIKITFTAQTTTALAVGTLSQNRVKAVGTRVAGSETQTFTATDFAYVVTGEMSITKATSATDPLYPGDQFTYTVTVTNPATATTTQTGISIYDPLPNGAGYVASSGSVTCERASNVRDEFANQAYTNNDGSLNWAGNWTEADIYGSGATGATGGFLWITGGQMQFRYQASNVADNFTSVSYTRNDGNTNWFNNWTETGDDGTAGGGSITVDAGNNNRVNFGPGAAGRAITRTARVSGGSVTIGFTLSNQGIDNGEGVIAEYDLGLGAGFQPIQQINNNTLTGTNPLTVNTAGATSITLRFRTFGTYTGNDNAGVDTVNIAFNDAVGTRIQRTADLTGAPNPSLDFSYSSANLEAADTLVVEASSSAAGPFTTLATFAGGTPDVAPPYDLTSYISAGTTIRFRVTGGYNVNNETFNIQYVDISYYLSSTFAAGSPPNFLASGTGCRIQPGSSLTLTYDVTVDAPLATGIDEITNTAFVNSNEMLLPLSASVNNAVVNPSSGSADVGDRVWLDSDGDGVLDVGEPGLANVELTLKDEFGTPVMITVTDTTGHYRFSGIEAGNGYYVEATAATIPAGLQQSAPSGHTDYRTGPFGLTEGQSYTTADLGFKPASGTATIGNYVWIDANADNRRNAGEPGIAGVAVKLYIDTNSNGTYEAGTDTLCTSGACGTGGTATTAPDGSYLFTGVTASGTQDYIVYIDETQAALSGYTRTSPPSGGALFSIINISSGTSVLYANFGYQGTTYFIKDQIWLDSDADGSLDAGEPGISGVTVDLLDASLNVIATTTTASDGTFTFTGVVGGGTDYTVRITDTGGKLTNYYGTTTEAVAGESDISNVTGDVDNTSSPSFGYNLSRAIGDTVFNDNGAGGGTLGDGSQNGSEPGLPGVTVLLYRGDSDNSFEPGGDDGNPVASLVTDLDGRYLFSGLADGTYWVHIDNTQATLSSFSRTTADDDLVVAGHQRKVTMSGSTDLGVDFGYYVNTPSSVSGTLWEDTGMDGVIDSGEAGIVGVTIDLLDASLSVVATTTTAANGSYSFIGLPGGNYTVTITDSAGVLTGYSGTWEKTELLSGPFDSQEAVTLNGDLTGINFGYFNPIPTLVVLSSFGVYNKNGQVVVRWETASELDTLGFNLFRLDPVTGEYKKVNSDLLPGIHKPHRGGKYSFKDTGASPGRTYTYKLVEVEIFGRELSYGPFTVFAGKKTDNTIEVPSDNSNYGRTERNKPESHKARMEGRKAKKSDYGKAKAGDRIKITVKDNGIYYMGAKDISSLMGISLEKVSSMINRGQLSLSNQGEQVAYLPVDDNASDDNTSLYFYGTKIDSIYTKENVYWLDKAKGTLMTVLEGEGPGPSAEAGSFTETLHFEEDVISWDTLFNDPNADYWFWDQLFASKYYTDPPASFTFQPLGLAPETATATLQINLAGGSDAGITNDHHVLISLNGQSVEDRWSGLTLHTITAEFPLVTGDNTITVTGIADEGVSSSFVLIDSFDVTYQRLYEADSDGLFFKGDSSPSVTIGGFSSSDIKVFDLTDPLMPKFNADASISGESGHYSVRLDPASANTSYLAVAAGGIKTASAKAVFASNFSSQNNAADYIVIAPAELVSTARGLADYRSSRGMKTMVVNLEDLMNEFNYGISSPEAIKAFLSVAYSKWEKAPKYVVLAGNGSMDYKDNLKFGGNLIPSKMVPTDYGLAISDNYLADINGDHLPEIAIGRLPVLNAGELQTVINKIKTYERNIGNKRVALVADMPDDGGDFIANSEVLAGLFPSAYNVNKIYLNDPAMADEKKAALIDVINTGAAFFNYVGHAGPGQLSNWGLLSYYPDDTPPTDDLSLLSNATILPVLTAITCGLANFSDPYQDVLSEALLLKPDGGVAAAWSATGLSDDAQAAILNREFYKAVLSGEKAVLGDAVLQALSVYKNQGTMPFMMDTYCILGDPALRIR